MRIAQARLEFLSGDERDRIIASALRVLEEVGIRVRSRRVRELLARNGARIDEQQERAWLPEALVRSALAEAPRSILLAAQDPACDLRIPAEEGPYVATGGEGVALWDLETGRSRPSCALDLVRFARLADQLDAADFFWPVVAPQDLDQSRKSLVGLTLAFRWTRKHVQHEALSPEEARGELAVAGALAGGPEALRERPLFSVVQCPISPLEFDRGLIEATAELTAAGIPIIIMAASMAGLTSSVTLAGTLVQTTAENLAEVAICELARPGAPVVFSSNSSAANLKTGAIDYMAPESLLIAAGVGQIGRALHLPIMVAGMGLERLSTTGVALEEMARWMSLPLLPHNDLDAGLGGYDSAKGGAFEQLIIDAEVLPLARRFSRRFSTEAEALALEVIREVGPSGLFVSHHHTMDHFKRELSSTWPDAGRLPRRVFAEGAASLVRTAKGIVRDLLVAHERPTPEPAALDAMRGVLRAARGPAALLEEPCGRDDPYAR